MVESCPVCGNYLKETINFYECNRCFYRSAHNPKIVELAKNIENKNRNQKNFFGELKPNFEQLWTENFLNSYYINPALNTDKEKMEKTQTKSSVNIKRWKCEDCGSFIEGNIETCPYCGSDEPEGEEDTWECVECGAVLNVDDIVCPECGTEFEETISPGEDIPDTNDGDPDEDYGEEEEAEEEEYEEDEPDDGEFEWEDEEYDEE